MRFKSVILSTPSFKQNKKEHTTKDYPIKEGIVNYNSLHYLRRSWDVGLKKPGILLFLNQTKTDKDWYSNESVDQAGVRNSDPSFKGILNL